MSEKSSSCPIYSQFPVSAFRIWIVTMGKEPWEPCGGGNEACPDLSGAWELFNGFSQASSTPLRNAHHQISTSSWRNSKLNVWVKGFPWLRFLGPFDNFWVSSTCTAGLATIVSFKDNRRVDFGKSTKETGWVGFYSPALFFFNILHHTSEPHQFTSLKNYVNVEGSIKRKCEAF